MNEMQQLQLHVLPCAFAVKKCETKQSSSSDTEPDSYVDKIKKKKKNKKRYVKANDK